MKRDCRKCYHFFQNPTTNMILCAKNHNIGDIVDCPDFDSPGKAYEEQKLRDDVEKNNLIEQSKILPFPFNKVFENKYAVIDYKSNGGDHKYVECLGHTVTMNSDYTNSCSTLPGLNLTSYGNWGTFYCRWADDECRQIFLDMFQKGIISLWRADLCLDGDCYKYDGQSWEKYVSDGKWIYCECPFV